LALLLRANGFEVVDLGVNVETLEFVEAVREFKPDILGMSALLTTTIKEIRKVVKALEKEGLRKEVKIIIGGAATSEEFVRELGVDAYAESALDGVRLGKKLIKKL
jgi:methanogenic corrinoid protein MtbC1